MVGPVCRHPFPANSPSLHLLLTHLLRRSVLLIWWGNELLKLSTLLTHFLSYNIKCTSTPVHALLHTFHLEHTDLHIKVKLKFSCPYLAVRITCWKSWSILRRLQEHNSHFYLEQSVAPLMHSTTLPSSCIWPPFHHDLSLVYTNLPTLFPIYFVTIFSPI